MAPIPDAGAGPPPSVGHDLVYDDALHAVLLVNAGLGSHDDANMAGQPDRIWSWDGVRWTLLDSSGPQVRSGSDELSAQFERPRSSRQGVRMVSCEFTARRTSTSD
jgi:hypothetical protein